MIVVEKLTKRFGDRSVVDEVSFNVDRGEILGFLGPNAAGKTTTMRMLTCYFPPTSGSAQVAGFDVVNDSLQVRRHVGYMPENVPLYHDMSVDSYLYFVASAKGIPGRERRKYVEEVISEMSLAEVRDYPIAKISRGYRQRVGLAQALIGNPDVLILDEPTVGLDPKQIVEIRALIKSLAQRATVILSTHIMQEVNALCSRVIIINGGRIVAVDTPENLREQMMRETVTVEMAIRGGRTEDVEAELKRVDGVLSVSATREGADVGRFKVEVSRSNDEVRPKLAARVVESNWGLLELHQKDVSLEDVFMKLVSQGGGANGDPAASGDAAVTPNVGDATTVSNPVVDAVVVADGGKKNSTKEAR